MNQQSKLWDFPVTGSWSRPAESVVFTSILQRPTSSSEPGQVHLDVNDGADEMWSLQLNLETLITCILVVITMFSSLQVTRVTKGTEDPQREDPKEHQVHQVYQVKWLILEPVLNFCRINPLENTFLNMYNFKIWSLVVSLINVVLYGSNL